MLPLSVAPALAEPLADLAARLAGLRGEVESLSEQLADESRELSDQLRSYARQKADLELQLERERTRIKKLRAALTTKRQRIATEAKRDQAYGPVFERGLGALRAYVASSLPFRTQERLDALTRLHESFEAGLLTPERALSRVWSFYDDEFRMTRENGLFRQVIVVQGHEQLADVAKIGMVMMFFRTNTGQVGKVDRSAAGWLYQPIDDKRQARLINTLFDSFRKQIRVGYFELPNALVSREVAR